MPIQSRSFSLVSLGCPKNLVDSEQYVFALQQTGLEFRTEVEHSELVVLNTCGFLHSARSEAREYIRALIDLKKQGSIRRIAVRGCMPTIENIERLAVEFPEVDEWFGVPAASEHSAPRHILTEKHVAYLRIADGCSRRCAFCTIPTIRGKFRSVPEETVIQEAQHLAESGVKELVVIAQETTFWGSDLYGKPQLATLLRKLENIDGIRWIRLMYSYPQYFEDDLIDLFAAGGKLLPYIDIPLQHANDEMLRQMNRRVSRTETETLLEKLRKRIANLVLRTSFIVGFPGETDAMFQELLRFADRWQFERAGVFRFSAEQGTPAAGFSPKVPAKTIDRRYDQLYKICEKHSLAWANRQKGKILGVQIDGNYVDESGHKEAQLFIGRTIADAPDIDPVVYVTGQHLAAGMVIECEILETEGCNLVGVAI
ncbi:MAG: MiaB/RimO family radical SAM methylthiotransferase [Planctomycetaceae bacterium]|nr:MiaB/RimO family radical SAM methylthiotransferase [Planctomycetaceae bacterium]